MAGSCSPCFSCVRSTTASPAAPLRTVPEPKLHPQLTLLRSQAQWAALHSPGALASLLLCCSVLGGLLRVWKGLHYSPEAPSQSEGRGTALENYMTTGQENKDSFRTIFLGLASRTCFWVSSKAPSKAHKKPGKHLTLQLTRHSQDSKELPLGANRLLCWEPLKHGCDITETLPPH